MPELHAERYRATVRYAVSKDFERDGVIATWARGGPVSWGQEDFVLGLDGSVNFAALDQNGELLALAIGSDIHIYSLGITPTALFSFKALGIDLYHVEWQPGEHEIGQAALLTSTAGGNQIEFYDGDILMRPLRPIPLSVNLHCVDVSKHQETTKASVSGYVPSVASTPLFPSGTSMLVAGKETTQNGNNLTHIGFVDIWDISGAQPRSRARLMNHTGAISWMGYSPDENIIGTTSSDGMLKLWSVASGNLIHSLDAASRPNEAAEFSHSSKYIANGYGGVKAGICIWSTSTGECVYRDSSLSGYVRSLAFSPDDGYLAYGSQNGVLKVLKLQESGLASLNVQVSQEWRRAFGANPLEQAFGEVFGVTWLDDGKKLAFRTGTDCGVEVYDFESNSKWRFTPQPGAEVVGIGGLQPVLWQPSTKSLISVDCDGRVRFWSV